MKERNKKIIFWSIVILCILPSFCMHRRMTHLEDDELAWLYNFSKYDTCSFISNYGGHSKLAVNGLNIWNSRNPFFIGFNQSWDYEASAVVNFGILQNDSLLDGYLQYRKVLPEKTLEISGYFGDLKPEDHLKMNVVEFEYDGRVFKECIILDSLNSHLWRTIFYPFNSDVRKVVYSKEYGLIYYSFSDGEEFFRVIE